MTVTTNARVAGFTFLFYIAVAASELVVFAGATSAGGPPRSSRSSAGTRQRVRVAIVLTLLTCFAALVLAVTLYRITRDQDPDLAMLALTCRVGEGVVSGIFILATLGLLWLGTASGASAPDAAAASALGLVGDPVASLMWLPMAAFEVPLGLWLLIKGVGGSARAAEVTK